MPIDKSLVKYILCLVFLVYGDKFNYRADSKGYHLPELTLGNSRIPRKFLFSNSSHDVYHDCLRCDLDFTRHNLLNGSLPENEKEGRKVFYGQWLLKQSLRSCGQQLV